MPPPIQLYLIEILRQTTTLCGAGGSNDRCILLKFYVKPQPGVGDFLGSRRCILLKFYVKPQPTTSTSGGQSVVSY